MPKSNNAKEVKKKLSPAERSQVAKDRWAKIRAAKATTGSPALDAFVDESIDAMSLNQLKEFQEKSNAIMAPPQPQQPSNQPPPHSPDQPPYPQNPEPEQPPVAPESGVYDKSPAEQEKSSPAPQLVPAAPKKQKRPPVPKEFLVALKTADKRLSDAIEEYEDCQRRIVYLEGAIPRLQRTFLALRNESNPDAPIATAPSPYNFSGSVPNATAFQSPLQQPPNPLAAIQAAMDAAQAAKPAFRATGGVQLTPDVIGTIDDSDDDIDRFITGSGADDRGWIGG